MTQTPSPSSAFRVPGSAAAAEFRVPRSEFGVGDSELGTLNPELSVVAVANFPCRECSVEWTSRADYWQLDTPWRLLSARQPLTNATGPALIPVPRVPRPPDTAPVVRLRCLDNIGLPLTAHRPAP